MTRHTGQLFENMTSITKPEVNNVSQRRRRRTEPWPQARCTENLMKINRVTDKQKYPTQYLAPLLGGRSNRKRRDISE